MSPEDVKKLREELRCSVSELAHAIDVDTRTVLEWEMGERFPTKRHVGLMRALLEKGPEAFPRASRRKAAAGAVPGLGRLADPKLWEIVRKLCAHPQLFEEAARIAERYEDPGQSATR
jgi:transcriptional regulator with XRE-family HTH domain